jgi:copper chaperone
MIVQTTTITIGGMSCGHCVQAVKTALGALAGVEVQEVQVGAATVHFDAARTPLAALHTAIVDAGFEVKAAS